MIADLRDLITQITESSDQQKEGAHAIAENAANQAELAARSEAEGNDGAAAIEAAVEKASESLRGLAWFEVTEFRGGIRDGSLEYQATIEVAFKID